MPRGWAQRAAAAQGERHRLRADGDSREAGQGEEGSRGDAGSLAAGDAARLLATVTPAWLFVSWEEGRPPARRCGAAARLQDCEASRRMENRLVLIRSPSLRHASDGERGERAYDSGPAGSPQPWHHGAVYACGRRLPERNEEPAGHAAGKLHELSRGGPAGPPAGGRRDPQELRSCAGVAWGGSSACGP